MFNLEFLTGTAIVSTGFIDEIYFLSGPKTPRRKVQPFKLCTDFIDQPLFYY